MAPEGQQGCHPYAVISRPAAQIGLAQTYRVTLAGLGGRRCCCKCRLQGVASSTFRLPHNRLAARSFVEHIDEEDHFLASPSVLQLPSGRILVLFEKCGSALDHRAAIVSYVMT